MRHAYGNANSDAHIHPDGDSDGYSHRHTVTNADLRTRWHTWAVGYCPARATRSLSRWWMHRWNKYLRIRRW